MPGRVVVGFPLSGSASLTLVDGSRPIKGTIPGYPVILTSPALTSPGLNQSSTDVRQKNLRSHDLMRLYASLISKYHVIEYIPSAAG